MRTKIKFNKNKLLFWLTIIDILFLPYFKLVVIPFSYFFIMYWVLKNYVLIMKYKENKIDTDMYVADAFKYNFWKYYKLRIWCYR